MVRFLLGFGCGDQIIAPGHGFQEGAQLEVVALRDRIELMLMAAGAGDAHAEEDIARDVGLLVHDVVPLAARIALIVFVDSQSQETRRDQPSGLSATSSPATDSSTNCG